MSKNLTRDSSSSTVQICTGEVWAAIAQLRHYAKESRWCLRGCNIQNLQLEKHNISLTHQLTSEKQQKVQVRSFILKPSRSVNWNKTEQYIRIRWCYGITLKSSIHMCSFFSYMNIVYSANTVKSVKTRNIRTTQLTIFQARPIYKVLKWTYQSALEKQIG